MKKVFLFLLSVITVLFFISCGSKPEAEETKPDAPVIEETTTEEPEVSDVDASEIEAIKAQIEDARKLAIEAGAEKDAPDQLKVIDDLYDSIKDDDAQLKANSKSIVDKYNLLANYSKAKSAKEEIDNNGFAFYSQKNYDDGVKCLETVETAFATSGDLNSTVYTAAEDAYKNFNTIIIIAYKKLAKAERELAYEAKKNADSVKAAVARKVDYKSAADTFMAGDSSYAMQNPKRALEQYTEAKEAFTALYEDVAEKRAAAQAALDEAKKRVAESAQYAEEADVRNPITEPVDGIEEEDAVLLEEDVYDNPEEAEADIAEELEDDIEETEVGEED